MWPCMSTAGGHSLKTRNLVSPLPGKTLQLKVTVYLLCGCQIIAYYPGEKIEEKKTYISHIYWGTVFYKTLKQEQALYLEGHVRIITIESRTTG